MGYKVTMKFVEHPNAEALTDLLAQLALKAMKEEVQVDQAALSRLEPAPPSTRLPSSPLHAKDRAP